MSYWLGFQWMKTLKSNGWTILFHPLFHNQWQKLLEQVKYLRTVKTQEDYVLHPQVKLFKALTIGIEEKISQDPLGSHFALKKPLNKYSRLKKMGLPKRYRLFFKVFEQQKVIIILWLGFPRKEGDNKDCYRLFAKMVEKGHFPASIEDLM